MPYKDQNWVEGTKLPPMKKLPPAAWQQPTKQEIPWYQKGYVGEATSTGESLLKTPVVQSVASVGKKLPGWILGRGGAESSQRGAIYGELAQALSAGYPEDPSMRQIGAIGKAGVNFATQTARGRVQQAISTGLKGGKSFAESLALADPRDVSLMGEKTLSDLYAMHMEERRYGEVEKPKAEAERGLIGAQTETETVQPALSWAQVDRIRKETDLAQANIDKLGEPDWEIYPDVGLQFNPKTGESKQIPNFNPADVLARIANAVKKSEGQLSPMVIEDLVQKEKKDLYGLYVSVMSAYNTGDPRLLTEDQIKAKVDTHADLYKRMLDAQSKGDWLTAYGIQAQMFNESQNLLRGVGTGGKTGDAVIDQVIE